MKAKCVKGGCGYEFENSDPDTFFDTIDDGDIIFEIERETCHVRVYTLCPLCGALCSEV